MLISKLLQEVGAMITLGFSVINYVYSAVCSQDPTEPWRRLETELLGIGVTTPRRLSACTGLCLFAIPYRDKSKVRRDGRQIFTRQDTANCLWMPLPTSRNCHIDHTCNFETLDNGHQCKERDQTWLASRTHAQASSWSILLVVIAEGQHLQQPIEAQVPDDHGPSAIPVSGVSLSDLVPSTRGWLGVFEAFRRKRSAICVDPLHLTGAFTSRASPRSRHGPSVHAWVLVRLHLRLPLRIESISSPKVGLCRMSSRSSARCQIQLEIISCVSNKPPTYGVFWLTFRRRTDHRRKLQRSSAKTRQAIAPSTLPDRANFESELVLRAL
ncbi:hypothetical protein B0T13DRAFT_447616 [Neurospora crassa]|nr:hypothetical protein B0T13DRAFT_447616 [Neurospora crassa]